ncbi:MAG TPA: RNA degradosome polyphosphate kinase [Acidimicrobiales bacterium]
MHGERTAEVGVTAVGGDDRNGTRFLNRELSWLAFNERVLALAADDRPLLERVKYLAIFADNLDEFFRVRVAGLKEQVAAGVTYETPDGRTPSQQLREIRATADRLTAEHEAVWAKQVRPALCDAGIDVADWSDLSESEQRELEDVFHARVFPILTPLAVDPGHPFPYISDLSLNLAVMLRGPDDRPLFARVKVPSSLSRFVQVGRSGRWVPLAQLIAAHLDALFPGVEVLEHHRFRVTRNADLTVREGEADDLLAAIETELRRRRFGNAIRLEVSSTMSPEVRELLLRELDLEPDDVDERTSLLDFSSLWQLYELSRPDLKDPVFHPVTEPRLSGGERSIFDELRSGDILLHHPYVSFNTSVVSFIQQAARDPHVLAIKITIYRTSGDSPIIEALIDAAEQGKQVAVLVELKARFDERANIEWARRLEEAGVHVAYGLVGYKIHTKVCLVIRDEPDGVRRYCHIGTGNYNPRTARLYDDLGLLTADPEIGADVAHLFNFLTGYGKGVDYRTLLVAPDTMRVGLETLIRREIESSNGRIVLKVNSLVDPDLIDRLYEASQAGVQIDLIVRGICCLRPGVPGLSENIRVRSIVGRYLEHSRIYRFANGDGPGRPLHLIGSADLMPRNLDRRVEVLVRVSDPALTLRLDEILDINLTDDGLAWELDADGVWTRHDHGTLDAHERLQQLAIDRARDTRQVAHGR